MSKWWCYRDSSCVGDGKWSFVWLCRAWTWHKTELWKLTILGRQIKGVDRFGCVGACIRLELSPPLKAYFAHFLRLLTIANVGGSWSFSSLGMISVPCACILFRKPLTYALWSLFTTLLVEAQATIGFLGCNLQAYSCSCNICFGPFRSCSYACNPSIYPWKEPYGKVSKKS